MRWWSQEDGFHVLDFDGEWVRVRYVVCSVCRGRGHYINPDIDGNGLSQESIDSDPDFVEMYTSGGFNISCNLCWGSRVMPVPESPADIARLREWENAGADSRAIRDAERQVGA